MIQEKAIIHRLYRFRPALLDIELKSPDIAAAAKPGQFVHLRMEGASPVLLRRPFSIAGAKGDVIRLIVKIVGKGTEALSLCEAGTVCDLIGPLGSEFKIEDGGEVFLIGGGIGTAPLLFLQDKLQENDISTIFFSGSRTREEFPLEEDEVAQRNIIACTDDSSYGKAGVVSSVFEASVAAYSDPINCVCSCGPVPMMKEITRICRKNDSLHLVSLESRMACGLGVCQGCALKLNRGENDDRGGYRLICSDGPVFNADQIEWDLL